MFVLEGFPWERLRASRHRRRVRGRQDEAARLHDGLTSIGCLRDRGYQVWVSEWHPIVRYGIRHQWHRLASSEELPPDPDSWGNLIAFRQPVDRGELGRALAGAHVRGLKHAVLDSS